MAPVSRISGRSLANLLPDLRLLPGPIYSALAGAVTALVLDGRVATQTRLPSERELATELRLSRATVTGAYDQLRADGYLTSRTGSGSFVTVPKGSSPRPSAARWVASGAEVPDVIDLSCAALPAPPAVLDAAVAIARDSLAPLILDDGYSPAGLEPLRAAVAARYTARGVDTRPEQILITNGALHAFDLLLRLLVGPGDRVVTELPTYPGALDVISNNRARAIPVPMDADGGWSVDRLVATLRQSAPRLAYLMPDFQNPTGALVDADSRQAVLRVARQTGTTVVVDESFVELGFRAAETPAAALDSAVISVGSMSKSVWAGLRVGWVRASADMISRLAALRASIDMGGGVLDQLVATELMGDLTSIAAERVRMLEPRRDALIAALTEQMPLWRFTVPAGGLSLWIELDAPLSTPLTMMALPAGVIIVAGPRFGVDGTLERFLRLPFSLPTERLLEAVSRLGSVWRQLGSSNLPGRQLVVA